MYIGQALNALAPGAEWSVNGEDYDQITWLSADIPKPTRAQVEAKIQELRIEWEYNEYQRLRAPEYPDLKELADALYWSSKGDNTKLDQYYDKCEEIKIKYPKP